MGNEKKLKISRLKGKQFKYILPLNRKAKKLLKESTVEWNKNYPKHCDLQWKLLKPGEYEYETLSEIPKIMNTSIVEYNAKNIQYVSNNLESFMA